MNKYSNLSVMQDSTNKVIDLKKKNRNVNIIQGGLAFGGSVAGLMYAIKMKKSFWGKVGYWILGGLIVGVPTSVGARLINSGRNAELEKIQSYLENQKKQEIINK